MLASLASQLRLLLKIPTLFNFIIILHTNSNKQNNIYKIYISLLGFTYVQRIMYCNIPLNSLLEIECMIFSFLNNLFYLLNFMFQTSHLVWMPTKVFPMHFSWMVHYHWPDFLNWKLSLILIVSLSRYVAAVLGAT